MFRIFWSCFSLVMITMIGPARAHDDHCAAIAASVAEAGFSDSVTVSCSDSHATITSDTYPDHDMMTGIIGTNEQVPVPAEYAAPIILSPVLGRRPLTRDAALGVAVNGVPIYDYTAGGEMSEADLAHHQARHDTLQTHQLDACGGHAGRGDDYHYHVKPTCMIEAMANAGDDAIIGWGFDGFPIYGDNNPDGSMIAEGALDVCNGQPDETFGYRYHTSDEAPYIVQCLMGEVPDFESLPRVRPLVSMRGDDVAPGRPPRGGVDTLVFTQGDDGHRSMDYEYQGVAYYIRYAPSGREDCYEFVTKTVTNDGRIIQAELCREPVFD
ncbi:YHYH protein [Roseobacter sp. A03A-229]